MNKNTFIRLLSNIIISCLICVYSQAQKPLNYHFPEKPVNSCYKDDANKCYKLIENQAHYLLTLVHSWNGNERYKLITKSTGGEEHITRPNTGAVAIFSFLYRFGEYNENRVGMTRNELLNKIIIPMMRYLIDVHKTGYRTFDNGRQWGLSWQSALWTHQLAQGAISVWNDLPEEIRSGILRIVWHEANRIASIKPPYALKYDSKSEENAWNAGALSAALILLPDDANTEKWEQTLKSWLLSAYIRPIDAFSEVLIDGKSLKEQFVGANMFDDFTLENHGLVHPDYMIACSLKGEIMIDFLGTDRPIPDACMFNVDNIYEQLKRFLLPSGGFIYPTGQDWAIFRHADWTNQHAFSLYYYHDPEALYWLRNNLDVIERMENRHEDGRIYGINENFFPSSQTLAGLGLVDTWKMLMLAKPVQESKPAEKLSKIYPDGKFFIRRTPNAVHSISWGEKIQIQVMDWNKDPLMAPVWNSGIGYIRLADEKKNLPVKLKSIRVDTLTNSIQFKMQVHHGDAIAADYEIISHENGKLMIKEKLTALRNIHTENISTLLFGILNHPSWIEENGKHLLKNNSNLHYIKSLSGESINLHGKTVKIDERLIIKSKNQIKGVYEVANSWNESKIFDRIILNNITELSNWNKNDIISENDVTLYYRD